MARRGVSRLVRHSTKSEGGRRNQPFVGEWRITRSLSSGARSRDPLANPPYARRAARAAIDLDAAGGARQGLAMRFEILGEISGIETFATGSAYSRDRAAAANLWTWPLA
jgi:hypothetical protein